MYSIAPEWILSHSSYECCLLWFYPKFKARQITPDSLEKYVDWNCMPIAWKLCTLSDCAPFNYSRGDTWRYEVMTIQTFKLWIIFQISLSLSLARLWTETTVWNTSFLIIQCHQCFMWILIHPTQSYYWTNNQEPFVWGMSTMFAGTLWP